MKDIDSIIYLMAASICSFCIVLFFQNRQRFSYYLILISALLWLGFVLQIFIHFQWMYWKHLWMFLAIVHSFIITPLISLYARQNDSSSGFFKNLNSPQKTVIIAATLMASPLLFLVNTSPDWAAPSGIYINNFWRIYYFLATSYVILYFSQALIYFSLSIKYLATPAVNSLEVNSWKSLFNIRGYPDETSHQSVLRLVLLGFLASIIVNFVRVIHCKLLTDILPISPFLSLVDILITITILLFITTTVIKNSIELEAQKARDSKQTTSGKYQNSLLAKDVSDRIKRKVLAAMGDPEFFTQNTTTLPKLASHINEKHHYVSQVINKELSTTFLELLNNSRITFATQLMNEKTDMAIIDIVESTGFNSKTTFYNAFARCLGPVHTN